jgi:tRNA pseudouridine13 synthase
MDLPRLLSDFPGVGGRIKQRDEDFFVQEIPLYEPSGQGEHVYCEVQKVGITTFEAIDRMADALHVSGRDIGYAGMKDAHAISRQVFSILGTTPEAVMAAKWPDLSVQWAARHGNKLRLGHLAGNRFAIRIRDVAATDVVKLKPAVERLAARGMPNYFGSQRFGRRGDNADLGAALVSGDDKAVLGLLLGKPMPRVDDSSAQGARAAFDAGDFEGAMKRWPRRSGMERRVLARFIKTKNPTAAVRCVDERLRRLWVSALQSEIFNAVVASRINTLDRLIDGDLAMKTDNGAVFAVPQAAVEQARCDAGDISPTGPLIGYRMTEASAAAREIEDAALATRGLSGSDFRVAGRLKVKGARRALRVIPRDLELSGGADEHGPHITVAFSLPAGSFATVLMRELMGIDEQDALDA